MIALTSLAACSSVPDRYAFWSDDIGNVHDSDGAPANLSTIPASPDTDEARDEMEEMRQRLENDRGNAYVDQEDAYLDFQSSPTTGDDMVDVSNYATATPLEQQAQPIYTPNSVQINYDALDQAPAYVYGSSASVYGSYYQDTGGYAYEAPAYDPHYTAEIATIMSQNPSITINPLPDFDAPVYGDEGTAIMPEGQLLFKHGSAHLSAKDKQYIKDLAQSLQSDYAPLRIVGHASTRVELADPFRARLVNLKMSALRAAAVYEEFKKNGITADRLNITAHGDSVPNLPVQGLSEEAADRRVEILID